MFYVKWSDSSDFPVKENTWESYNSIIQDYPHILKNFLTTHTKEITELRDKVRKLETENYNFHQGKLFTQE
jgi:septation ring formation regulator EzrA